MKFTDRTVGKLSQKVCKILSKKYNVRYYTILQWDGTILVYNAKVGKWQSFAACPRYKGWFITKSGNKLLKDAEIIL